MSTSEPTTETRGWLIRRTETHEQIYTGILADCREAAIEAFLNGEGELDPSSEAWSAWKIEALEFLSPQAKLRAP